MNSLKIETIDFIEIFIFFKNWKICSFYKTIDSANFEATD